MPALLRMTDLFYRRCFVDPHVDQFLRDHADPHGRRFAAWLAQKMGDPAQPWDADRAARGRCPVAVGGGYEMVVHDRSSAHQAAWMSPKRPAQDVGRHFQLDDCRAWMRLMFWSARDAGLLDHPQFADWYVRFIGHFVRVYERSAPPFVRLEARWSANPDNVDAYRRGGRRHGDIIG
eukprot:gene2515-42946_t